MIVLWELGGREGRRYSLFSWRTRMALAHKGLEFEATPVLMSDKAAIAFSGGKTVPVIRDGDAVVRDSWKIAEHLEARYPERPTLFGGEIGRGVTHAFNTWVDRALLGPMLQLVAPDIHVRVDPADQAHFRAMVEGAVKKTLEDLAARRAESLERLARALEPLQTLTRRQPYVCGSAPAYGDYILFSLFQWVRLMSPQEVLKPADPLHAWREKLLDLHGGLARAHAPQ
ncbi:MAG TPA: glutathione S-transferase N-terminal domain-containing protein [Burkholderiales bacterium]|nr:glutathione S-transferase N-terminal domain-containing protein [Burkholderiales bacterium]